MATAKATTITKVEVTGVTLHLSKHEAQFLYSIYNMIGHPGSSKNGAILSVWNALKDAGVEKLTPPNKVWRNQYADLSDEYMQLADMEAKD